MPGFRAGLYHKDMGIALNGPRTGVPAPTSAVVQQLVSAMIAAGQGDDDYSALATVVFRLAGLA